MNQMLNQGSIEPSFSPWVALVVFLTKKDGTTQFCVDYRKLNFVTKGDVYSLPRIDQTFDALTGSTSY